MAAAQVASGVPLMDPNADMIQFVMRECQCDEARARKLLTTSKGDPHKAVVHHQKLAAILARQGHSRAPSQTTQAPAPAPDIRTQPTTWNHAPSNGHSTNGWTAAQGGGASASFTGAGFNGNTTANPATAYHNGPVAGAPSTPDRPPPPPPFVPYSTTGRPPVYSLDSGSSAGAIPTPSVTPRTPSPNDSSPPHFGSGAVPIRAQNPPAYRSHNPVPAGAQAGIPRGPSTPSQGTDEDHDTPMTDPLSAPEIPNYARHYSPQQPSTFSPTRGPYEPVALPPAPVAVNPASQAPPFVYSVDPAESEVSGVPGIAVVPPPLMRQAEPPFQSQNQGPQDSLNATDPREWNFRLPRLPMDEAAAILAAGRDDAPVPPQGVLPTGGGADFSLRKMCAAVQYGGDVVAIQKYLREFTDPFIKRRINGWVEGVPSIFYAVETDEPAILRLWAGYGANISAVHPATGTPLLAYAIVLSDQLEGRDTSPMVATLLSLGASPKCLPDEFYAPYNRDLPEDGVFQADNAEEDGDLDEEDEDEDEDAYPPDGEVNSRADKAKAPAAAPLVAVRDEWQWCSSPAVRAALARTANLTQRYYLDRATKLKRAGVRHRQIAALRNAEAILGIPYYLIGQTIAANRLLRKLLTYITVPSKKPLVLAFAGPSGHGKTELARKLGYLLGLELQVVDCTIVNTEKELFGPRAPYVGSERGSPLNNFIAQNAGRRSIVFLDEFEKTSREIHQSLLLPFDNGEYQDRRSLQTIDCSRTIWILATNALDQTIIQFCGANPAILQQGGSSDGDSKNKGATTDSAGHPKHNNADNDDNNNKNSKNTKDNGADDGAAAAAAAAQRLSKKLSTALRAAFLDQFGAPVTGRVSDFIPFLPFSRGEQAVVVHKFLLELAGRVADPVRLRPGPEGEQLLGSVRLRVRRDASVCARLAETEYSEELGARSLRKAVEDVQDWLVESYLDEDHEIEEGESTGLKEFVVDVKGDEVVVSKAVGERA